MKSISTLSRLLSLSLLAVLACKPKGAGSVKAIVGEDAEGRAHAFSLLTIRNIPKANLAAIAPSSNGSRYAKEQLDAKFFGIVDCVSAGGQSAEDILADMELDAALGNIFVDKDRYMWRLNLKSGKIDQRLPCAVVGSRMVTVNVINAILDQPYKSANPTANEIRNAQQIYLALRGNTIKAGNTIEYKQLSAPMSAYITANRLHYDLGASTISANLKLVEKFDADFNPCSPVKSRFSSKAAFSCVPAGGAGAAFNYRPVDNVMTVRDELVANIESQHIATFKYADAKAKPFDVLFEVLTSTASWGSKGGNAGKLGAFLAGKTNVDFNKYFASATYGVSPAGTLLGATATGLALANEPLKMPDPIAKAFPSPALATPVGVINLPGMTPFGTLPASSGSLPIATPISNTFGVVPPATSNAAQTRAVPNITPLNRAEIANFGDTTRKALSAQQTYDNNANVFVYTQDKDTLNRELKPGEVRLDKDQLAKMKTDSQVDAAFAASVNREMLNNKQATLTSVMDQVSKGTMTDKTQAGVDPPGVQRFVGGDGETAFISRSTDAKGNPTIAVQDWKVDRSPASTAGANSNTTSFINSAFGDPTPNGSVNELGKTIPMSNDRIAGLGQTISVDKTTGLTQRAAQVNFAEDGKGAYEFKLKDDKGMAQIDCGDAATKRNLLEAGDSYRKAQENLRSKAVELDGQIRKGGTDLDANVARREQVEKEIQQNDKLAGTIRAMTQNTNCKGAFDGARLRLTDDGEGDGGCGGGNPEAPDADKKDPATTEPEAPATTEAAPNQPQENVDQQQQQQQPESQPAGNEPGNNSYEPSEQTAPAEAPTTTTPSEEG